MIKDGLHFIHKTAYILYLKVELYIIHEILYVYIQNKSVNDRKIVNKYRLYLLLGVMIFNLIDYIYIYMLLYFMLIFVIT